MEPTFFADQAELELESAAILEDTSPRNCALLIAMAAEMTSLALLAREDVHPELPPDLAALSGMLPDGHPGRAAIEVWNPVFARIDVWRYPNEGGGLDPVPDERELATMLASARTWLSEVRASLPAPGPSA